MDPSIGATFREARSRRKLDFEEVEAAIKIRARFLRAIENEEWDVLPGGTYTRGFIRTYGNYLGLDGDRLADDYRRATAGPAGERSPRRVEPMPTGSPRRGSRRPRLAPIVAVAGILVALGIAFAIDGGGGDGGGGNPGEGAGAGVENGGGEEDRQLAQREAEPVPRPKPGVDLELRADAEVWVCLLDAAGEPLVDGAILAGGEAAGPFRSAGYELALGNGSVTMTLDGEAAAIEESSSPVGYSVSGDGELSPLEEGERPECQ